MKLKLVLTVIFIAAVLSLGANRRTFLAFAAPDPQEVADLNSKIQAQKDKIKELQTTIDSYKKSIVQKQTEAVSLRNQLNILDNHIAESKTEIELTQGRIDQAKLEIEALELTIADKQKTINKQKDLIAKMVREINADKQKNYLEIMLTNKSFAEFFDQVQYLQNVYTDLGQTAKALRLAKEDLEKQKVQVQNRKETYDNLKKDLEDKQQNLVEDSVYKQDLLTQTKDSEQKFRTMLSSLKQQEQQTEQEEKKYEDEMRKKLAEKKDQHQLSGSTDFNWPVPGRYITARFHDPDYPFRKVFEHSGVDIRSPQGTPVVAAASGYVARAKHCASASCYSYVLIVHGGNLSTLYGHLSAINVAEDQFVNQGDIIGNSGGTPGMVGSGPFVTGPHLHFEMRQSGIPIDPMPYLP